ncbi:hypothetical protein [uncultured Desulfovibrio sp.]|uniref:hypothetical protein n=1 Tax=uncultured Desulfovibrio sp. TaxID=167968 RepID=UPI00260C7D12|nr:hypothetical protein [uncultured Desulfovibrio sp.]
MATNGILTFCPDGTENAGDVLSQDAYAVDTHRLRGNQAGIARRELVNKALRQACLMASVLGQVIADKSGGDVLDTNSVSVLASRLSAVMGGGPVSGGTVSGGLTETQVRALLADYLTRAEAQALLAGASGGGSGAGGTGGGLTEAQVRALLADYLKSAEARKLYMPVAQNSSAAGGVRALVGVKGQPVYVPSGGTWLVWFANNDLSWAQGVQICAVYSGGAQLIASSDLFWGWAWRIQ